jgi:hypothetical protein
MTKAAMRGKPRLTYWMNISPILAAAKPPPSSLKRDDHSTPSALNAAASTGSE